MNFNEVSPFDLNFNFFKGLLQDWAVLGVGDASDTNSANIMTISWGGTGIIWNKPYAVSYVGSKRFTNDLLEKYDTFTLNFFEPNKFRKELKICGEGSGKEVNRFEKTGFNLKNIENTPAIEEAKLILHCKVLYSDLFKEDNFVDKKILQDFYAKEYTHKFFIGEILNVFQAK